MTVINNSYNNRIGRVPVNNLTIPKQRPAEIPQESFSTALNEAIQKSHGLRFSKHAEARLSARNIKLSDNQINKLSNAVSMADRKGVKDSLILMDDLALVVNVKNRTVITAVNSGELKENVFTNIDGAVIL